MTAFAAVVILFSLSKEESQVEVIWTFVAFIIVVVGTYFLVFEIPAFTKITAHSIQIKYRPWIWNWKVFKWYDVKSVTAVEVNPLSDFGGWGFRFTLKGKRGVIMSNGPAVKIELKSGRVYVVTTQRLPELLRSASGFLNEGGLNG